MKKRKVACFLVLFFIITILFSNTLTYSNQTKESILKKVGSFENFKKIIDEAIKRNPYVAGMGYDSRFYSVEEGTGAKNPDLYLQQEQETSERAADNYSQTNVQVQGVDEADLVKTDGKYIYLLRPLVDRRSKEILIVKSYPPKEMKIVKRIAFPNNLNPVEFYVDNKYLVVICEDNASIKRPMKQKRDIDRNTLIKIPPVLEILNNQTIAIVYDITDKANPKEKRKVIFSGRYESSRKIGLNLYIVTRKLFDYDLYISKEYTEKDFMPYYSDSNYKNSQKIYIGFDRINYIPDFIDTSINVVGSFNIEFGDVSVESILGGCSTVYSSKENLYLCASVIKKTVFPLIMDRELRRRFIFVEKTAVVKFYLEGAKVLLKAATVLNGKVLNQFSMDEYNRYFRVAMTGERFSIFSPDFDTFNAVYILDENLKIAGKIDDIAKGERIYAARFIEDRLYLVTFKRVDPFFVIDLKDPQNPKILGYLKIPGYSTYLHQYDENHIIGFGIDTDDSGFGAPLGLKIALFDVKDVKNPKELFKVVIGGRGSTSELIYNHKALLFDKDKNIFAFPLQVYNRGTKEFDDAYVYSIDIQKGFVLKGKICHEVNLNNCEKINRLLYIEDVIYSVSDTMIKASFLRDLSEISSLKFEQ